jgi:WD40 repeat protein
VLSKPSHIQLENLTHQILKEHGKEVTSLTSDSNYVYSVSRDGFLIVWDRPKKHSSQTISIRYKIPVCDHGLESLCCDDEFIYAGGVYIDSKVWIWDKDDFIEEAVLTHHSNSILDLSVKGDRLVCGSADGSISIIETPNWFDPQLLETDQKILQTVEIDDHYIYAGGIGNKVSIFNIDNQKLVAELTRHEANIFALTNDETYLYSGSGEIWWGGPGSPRPSTFESAVRVWKKSNWECVGVLEGHKDNVNDIMVHQENVYSVSDDGTLRIYSKEDWSQRLVVEVDQRINAITGDTDSIYLACGDSSIIQIDRESLSY